MKTVLHIVNKRQSGLQFNHSSLDFISNSDAMLLIENGVYDALCTVNNHELLSRTEAKIYALGPDLDARGFDESSVLDYVKLIDYDGFVQLTEEFETSMSW